MPITVNQKESSESKPLMSPQGRRQGVSLTRIQERKNQIIKLRRDGFTTRSITQVINGAAEEKQWGTIGERQVQRVLAKYFSELKYQSALEEYGARESYIALLEQDAMTLLRHLHTKKDWAPFEKIHAFRACATALQRIIDVRGLNMCRSKNHLNNKKSYLPPEPPDYPDCSARKDIMDFFDLHINNPEVS